MFALSRLGYTVLILSPRLAVTAYSALLKATRCSCLIYASSLETTISSIPREDGLQVFKLLTRSDFSQPSAVDIVPTCLEISHDPSRADQIAYIMHSSGSTGLPKPIYQTHKACIQNYTQGFNLRGLLTAPLFHTHGHANIFRSMHKRQLLYLLNANLPLTSPNLTTVITHIKPELVLAVPYALKLIAERSEGVEMLRNCKVVSSAGSAMPDELGDRLVANGVFVVSFWGT